LVPTYDIFAGRYGDLDVRWIQAVEGLSCANERMKEIAAKQYGPYFIFDAHSHKVLASVDTTMRKADAMKSA